MQNTKNLTLMNYKLKKKKKKNQSHILNKNHHITKITIRFILLKIREKNDHKKYYIYVRNLICE